MLVVYWEKDHEPVPAVGVNRDAENVLLVSSSLQKQYDYYTLDFVKFACIQV